MHRSPVRVLIVDDSAFARQTIANHLSADPQITIVSTARDPIVAERKIEQNLPDVILLDIEMPRMNGLAYLRSLRKRSAVPVVIFSAFATQGSQNAIMAMELGAVAVMSKPQGENTDEVMAELAEILKGAAKVNNRAQVRQAEKQCGPPKDSSETVTKELLTTPASKPSDRKITLSPKVIAVGASTGGTDAVRDLLQRLPRNCPPILVVIHMPKGFTYRFAERLNKLCSIGVKEAENNDLLREGMAFVAPGDQHLVLKNGQSGYLANLQNGPPVKRHKPSVEVLFQSVARVAGHNALGIILTGMGSDGAEGLTEMHRRGAYTVAQNEETCIVFGMPKEAIKLGGVDEVLGLNKIPEYCIKWMDGSY